ncbi:hypothetical protein UFOVP267_20 [uncultured Caudovirales phage]|uniref:Uncharacterized protein n=1 Tax=uncultured Caudovirales phage TaxID=2100421 RepID=A0A6J5LHF3_9CAUD|nr:hypothetical protein UFOVP267_20 [uncultured Caudovirales phage]
MTQEALKLALEALEANYLLVNGTETHGGLEQCLDGYYSGCFDTDPINKQTEEAITAIKEALAQTQEPVACEHKRTSIWTEDQTGHCNDCGASGRMRFIADTTPPQRTEQNFCSRCGKRTADLTTIHTCTPPQKNT